MHFLRRAFLAAALAALAPLAPLAVAAPIESATTAIEGVLTVAWGDPSPEYQGGGMRFRLNLPNGTRVPLDVAEADRTALVAHDGKKVRVQGRAVTSSSGQARVAATAVTRLAVEPQVATAATAVTGTRRVLFIMLKFKGDTQAPHNAAFFKALTNPTTPTTTLGIPASINGFFAQTSWNNLQWQADVVGAGGLRATGWLTLPRTKATYAPCGWSSACADLDRIGDDAMALVKKLGVNVAVYDSIAFVLNNDLDCCAWGGSYYYAGNGKIYGATWEPPWGQEAETYVHEFGHSIGLPHSGWVYGAYDSPWDEMSDGSTASRLKCGTYKSANSKKTATLYCKEPGGGYITAHKDYLGWVPSANAVIVDQPTTTQVTLEADALPLGTATKMIRICIAGAECTGSAAHYVTVEARMSNTKYDTGLPGNGVIIHDVQMDRGPIGTTDPCFFNDQSGWAVPVDATAGDWNTATCSEGTRTFPNYALYNAQFDVGSTWSAPDLGITVSVDAATATGYTVTVTRQ